MAERRFARARSHRLVAMLTGLLAMAMLSACVSIPNNSSPQPLGSLERHQPTRNVPTPRPGMDPEILVRDFLKASVQPGSGHLAARQFLTQDASNSWDDQGGALLLDEINVLSDDRTDDTITVRVNGENTGELQPSGQLIPSSGRIETRLSLRRVEGQWRIDGPLPVGVMMDREQFEASYRPHVLYYPSTDDQHLVADPRWLYAGADQLADQLIGLLIAGPVDDLRGAVTNEFPARSSLHGSIESLPSGGVRLDLAGLNGLGDADRNRLAAQIIWTLSDADISGPYVIDADGAPLNERRAAGWQTRDVESLDPSPPAGALGLHIVRGGSLQAVADNAVTPVPGPLGTTRSLLAADISADAGRVAAVSTNIAPGPAPRLSLGIGDYGAEMTPVLEGETITRPSFAGDSRTVWVVVDENRVTQVTQSPGVGQVTEAEVDSTAIRSVAQGAITELQISQDGARAAMIVGGQVVLAIVERRSDGRLVLSNPRGAAALNIAGAVSLDWLSSETLVIARSAADGPVVQLRIDGTPPGALPSGNLTPPVTSVVAGQSTIYAADSRGVLRLGSTNDEPDQYWSEITPTMGSNAIPVLPH
ncbi:sporulation and spore germination protein [Williamsia limnetica]|uniref:Lipoprotein LpqB n=1 Tax=Williamsia limnetica TaxID=882452 RepID=A0A318RFF6_WILLI|nr:MtrAB system accessory lipoprotein LpqB [Williamsia limnetica]PYE14278.1 sporulation and spore germination protein [Williamsia limnetica]